MRELRRAIAVNRRDGDSYRDLAALWIQEGKFDEALNVYTAYWEQAGATEQVVAKRWIAQTYVEMGDRAIREERLRVAADLYEHALAFDPSAVPMKFYLGLVLLERGPALGGRVARFSR